MKQIIIYASLLALTSVSSSVLAKTNQAGPRTAEFTAANTDTSNDLTLDELKAYKANQIASRFNTLDTDVDGLVSQVEFTVNETDKTKGMANELFTLADTDGIAGLSVDEFTSIAPGGTGEILHDFVMMDKNFDLFVSLDEYVGSSKGGKGSVGKGGHAGKAGPGGKNGHSFGRR